MGDFSERGTVTRSRRRRVTIAVAASAVLVVAVLGGLGIARAIAGGPGTALPAGPAASPTPSSAPSVAAPVAPSAAASQAPLPADAVAVQWLSAIVSRDDRTITIHTGAGDLRNCKQLESARADATVQDAGQVVISVRARVITAADCSLADNDSVKLTVTLPADLGTRTVRDAATGVARTVFRERYLPQLPAADWSATRGDSWPSADVSWDLSYNGPNGGEVVLMGGAVGAGATGATVRLGTRQGLISGSGGTTWWVTWQADGLTYGLRYLPSEGASMTLDEFKQLLGTMTWS